jgi:FAD/FMN-containing dehydrogenase
MLCRAKTLNRIATRFYNIALLWLIAFSIHAVVLNDNGKLNPTEVTQVISVHSDADIINAIQQASKEHVSIAIMGKQHSQGGQSLATQAIELNTLSFNKVLQLDLAKKQIVVQPGITWQDLQNYINQKLSNVEIERTKLWTQELINSTILVKGRYYLPYQGFATRSQFEEVYPEYQQIVAIKTKVDKNNLFMNHMYQQYFM